MLNEILLKIKGLSKELKKIEELLNPIELENRKNSLENDLNKTNWSLIEKVKEHRSITSRLELWKNLHFTWMNLQEIAALAIESEETDLIEDIERTYGNLLKDIANFQLELMFTEEYDENNVILTIHAGAGGKEAQDWANMLFRMYCHWAERHNFTYNILDYQTGEDSTVCKTATIEIVGKNAYGLLKNENGVHRLVRVSPFDSQNRRHTSFAAIEVMPEITPDMNVEIDNKDLQIDTYRASGAGGQHVNKTESAVRITHKPTGIVVSCQNERSQYQNKDAAMKMLLSKLIKIKEQQHLDKISDIQGEHKQIQWGSQIRSYVFMPYQMVKDHRSNYETGNINAVMDGNIDDFIYKSLVK